MPDTSLPINRGNRHPVDQLADTRAEIKRLQDVEADLKAQITTEMGSRDSLGGDEWIAVQTLQSRKGSIDEDLLKRKFGAINIDDFRKPASTAHVLRVERRVQEVA